MAIGMAVYCKPMQQIFGPDLEFLGPGSSMLCCSDVIAAEVEEVIDLIVEERKRCA